MFDKKIYSQYKDYLKEKLSKKRYKHSVNVAESALKLARMYNADENKAYLAGLLHDVCKEMPIEDQFEYVKKSKLDVCEIEIKTTALYHSIAGSLFIQEKFEIDDEEVINAIRYHTVACKNMSKLSKIIYIADLISADRNYKDVKKMRKYADQSIDKAMYEALKFSISDSIGKDNFIPISTLECYNDLVNLKKVTEGVYVKSNTKTIDRNNNSCTGFQKS